MTKPLVLYLFMFANLLQFAFSDEKIRCFLSHPYKVQIINMLPGNSPSLLMHCAAGDMELGYVTVPPSKDYTFSFCEWPLKKTLYFCHLWWGKSKTAAFVVFDRKWSGRCQFDVCYWQARRDGIYFNLQKTYDWNNTSIA